MKILAPLIVVAIVLTSCITGLKMLSESNDWKSNIAILMKEVDKLEPDGDWKCLFIPSKSDKDTGYAIFKKIEGKSWGLAVLGPDGAVIAGYSEPDGSYYISYGPFSAPISEQDFEKMAEEWVGFVLNDGDLDKAGRFNPAGGTET